jgi:hypothetical protein
VTKVGADQDPYIQAQIEARQRPAVIKIRLLNFRSRYPEGLILAVEGNDDKVAYSCWLEKVRSDLPYEFFVCGGKRIVRQLKNLLLDDMADAAREILFFVDRDFDELDGFRSTERVFMLDRYSIENYVVDKNVLEACLKVAYPGHGDPATRGVVCEIFASDYASFLTHTADLNERIFVARRSRYDIDSLMPDSIGVAAAVELGNVTGTGKSAADILPFPQEPSEADLQALKSEFSQLDPARRFRGKFAIRFLRTWLDKLAQEFRDPKTGMFPRADQDSGRIKHDEFSLGSLASKSEIPKGLCTFLSASGY